MLTNHDCEYEFGLYPDKELREKYKKRINCDLIPHGKDYDLVYMREYILPELIRQNYIEPIDIEHMTDSEILSFISSLPKSNADILLDLTFNDILFRDKTVHPDNIICPLDTFDAVVMPALTVKNNEIVCVTAFNLDIFVKKMRELLAEKNTGDKFLWPKELSIYNDLEENREYHSICYGNLDLMCEVRRPQYPLAKNSKEIYMWPSNYKKWCHLDYKKGCGKATQEMYSKTEEQVSAYYDKKGKFPHCSTRVIDMPPIAVIKDTSTDKEIEDAIINIITYTKYGLYYGKADLIRNESKGIKNVFYVFGGVSSKDKVTELPYKADPEPCESGCKYKFYDTCFENNEKITWKKHMDEVRNIHYPS